MRTMLDEVMFKNEGGKIRLTNRVSGEFEKKKKKSAYVQLVQVPSQVSYESDALLDPEG